MPGTQQATPKPTGFSECVQILGPTNRDQLGRRLLGCLMRKATQSKAPSAYGYISSSKGGVVQAFLRIKFRCLVKGTRKPRRATLVQWRPTCNVYKTTRKFHEIPRASTLSPCDRLHLHLRPDTTKILEPMFRRLGRPRALSGVLVFHPQVSNQGTIT